MKLSINSKKFKYGTFATVITVIVIAAAVLVNIVLSLVSKRVNFKIDLTNDSIFEITQESKDYLNTINQDVEIVVMCDELVLQSTGNIYHKQAYEVLQKYAVNSENITLKFVDMTKDPTYANRFSEIYKGTIDDYSIVVNSGDRIKVFLIDDLYNTEIDYYTYSYQYTSSKAEQVLTSAVMYVTDPAPKTAVVLDADTESLSVPNIDSLLSSNGFDIQHINPLLEAIPMDADMLVINAPTNDFSEDIITQLYNFMENGGNYGKNMIYTAGYGQKETKNIDSFLAEWGIEIENSIISDSNPQNLASATTMYALRNFIEANDYSENVAQISLPVVSYQARPVKLLFENSGNVSAVPLLTTDVTSFKLTLEMIEQLQQGTEPDITEEQLNTMSLSSKYTFNQDNEQIFSNLLVFGSHLMLEESLTNSTYYNNGDYFVSIIGKISGKSNGINIVAKNLTPDTFDMNITKYNTVRNLFVIILPIAVLVTGLIVWLRRRHK